MAEANGAVRSMRRRLEQAEKLYRAQGRRFTLAQRNLYCLLLEAAGPLSAYQLLDALNRTRRGRVYPQSVYRVLASLQECGLVHKLESANAYRACSGPGRPHRGIHLLCDVCGSASELVDQRIGELLEGDAGRRFFRVQRQMIELHGVCADCDRRGTT